MNMRESVPALRFGDEKPIRGFITLELFDAKTKKLIQKVEKENMVTNAIKNALQAYAATKQMDNIMPLYSVGLGGIMLFDDTLDADPDKYTFPMDAHLVGYATQNVNTVNTMQGSKNDAESSIVLGSGGRSRTVWDFGTSQANGTIKSVALTRAGNVFRPLSNAVVAQACYYNGVNRYTYYNNAIIAYEAGYVYVINSITSSSVRTGSYNDYTYTRTYTMTICKTYAPMKNYKVGDGATNNLVTPNEVHETLSWTQVTYNTDPALNEVGAICVDFENDGSFYLIWSPGNSSGNGQLYITRFIRSGVNPSWAPYSTEIVSFTGAKFLNDYHKVVDGKFFVVSYDRHSIYKIDIENLASIQQITLPEGWYFHSSYFWRTPMKDGGLLFTAYTDRSTGQQTTRYLRNAILYPDGTTVLQGFDTQYQSSYIMDHLSYPLADGYGWGGQPGDNYTQYLYGRFFSNNLGTIANLQTPVVKNASQTLKITYSLVDA